MSEYLDPFEEVRRHGNKLPHWQQSESMQFVTFRLGDAMPESALRAWKEEHSIWKLNHPKPGTADTEQEYHRRFTRKLEYLLDEGEGSCLLKNSSSRKVLEETLMRDHGGKAIPSRLGDNAEPCSSAVHRMRFAGIADENLERCFGTQDRRGQHLAERLPGHDDP